MEKWNPCSLWEMAVPKKTKATVTTGSRHPFLGGYSHEGKAGCLRDPCTPCSQQYTRPPPTLLAAVHRCPLQRMRRRAPRERLQPQPRATGEPQGVPRREVSQSQKGSLTALTQNTSEKHSPETEWVWLPGAHGTLWREGRIGEFVFNGIVSVLPDESS